MGPAKQQRKEHTLTDQETFDLSAFFDDNAPDWPFVGSRTVVLDGVVAAAHDRFGNIYDDAGKRVDYREAKNYDKDNLPVGYEYHPNVDLVLRMAVDDQGLPEPEYPPRIPLGDTRTVRIADDGTFQFLNSKGEVKNPQSTSWFATFVNALGALGFGKLIATQFVNASTKAWNPAALNGLALIFDGVRVLREGAKAGDEKVRAWPVAVATADTAVATAAPAAASPAADEALVALANSDVTDDEFRAQALTAVKDPNVALSIAQDPAAFRKTLVTA